jgi:hypothetical protein
LARLGLPRSSFRALPVFRKGQLRGSPGDPNPNGGTNVTIVGILIVIILVLLVIYLFQRVR